LVDLDGHGFRETVELLARGLGVGDHLVADGDLIGPGLAPRSDGPDRENQRSRYDQSYHTHDVSSLDGDRVVVRQRTLRPCPARGWRPMTARPGCAPG